MPYVNTTTNTPIPADRREAIKARLGRDVSIIGKSESNLMVDFRENSPLYFKGTPDPAAIVAVDLRGEPDPAACDKLTGVITKLLGEELGIPAERVFVKYQVYTLWGWNGANL